MKEGIFSHKRWAPIVAALLIFAMVGTGTWVYADDYEVNAVEVNGDEFMIMVNRRGKVTSVEREGEEIRFENDDLRDFLEELFDRYEIETIALMGDSQEESEKLAEEIKEMIEEKKEEAEERTEEARERAQGMMEAKEDMGLRSSEAIAENMEINGLSPEDVEKAKDLGITPGKYNIIQNLMGKDVEEYLVYLEDEYDLDLDLDDDEDYKELSKRIMEEFSASRGEKNGIKFQEDRDEKVKKDKDKTDLEETRVLESRELDHDDDNDLEDDNEEDTDDSGRPVSPGNSGDAKDNPNSKNR